MHIADGAIRIPHRTCTAQRSFGFCLPYLGRVSSTLYASSRNLESAAGALAHFLCMTWLICEKNRMPDLIGVCVKILVSNFDDGQYRQISAVHSAPRRRVRDHRSVQRVRFRFVSSLSALWCALSFSLSLSLALSLSISIPLSLSRLHRVRTTHPVATPCRRPCTIALSFIGETTAALPPRWPRGGQGSRPGRSRDSPSG